MAARAWSFLTLDDDRRQYGGNTGYQDQLDSHYSFDKTVPNSARVSSGDLAVLRDGQNFIGFGWIDEVESWIADKERRRCPECSRTGFKARSTASSEERYRCPNCLKTFKEPQTVELPDVPHFRAFYGRTWRPLERPLSVRSYDAGTAA